MNYHLKTVQLPNGETIGYREREGDGEPFVQLHGNMSSSLHLDGLLETIDSRLKLYAIDLRGFGVSSYNRPIDSLGDFAEDLRLFADAVGLPSFHLMGWSTGGGVAMQFAADHPERVGKLVLLASMSTRGFPFCETDGNGLPDLSKRVRAKREIAALSQSKQVSDAIEKKDKAFLRALFNAVVYTNRQSADERYEQYLGEMLLQRNLVDVYNALNTFNISHVDNGAFPGTGVVERIQAPTLVLWGAGDAVISEQMMLEIKEDLGATARLVRLDECRHAPQVDDVQLVAELIEQFIFESNG